MVILEDIIQAQKNIASYAKVTPLIQSKFASELIHGNVFLKLENQQVTNSFKIRGVINKLLSLSAEEKAKGVVTASAGNHGKAVAYGAQKLGFQAKIVVPTRAPRVKVDGIRQFGAEPFCTATLMIKLRRKQSNLRLRKAASSFHRTMMRRLLLDTEQPGLKS